MLPLILEAWLLALIGTATLPGMPTNPVNNNKTKLKATFDPLRLGIDMGIDKGFHEASQTTPNGTQFWKLIE